MAPIIIVNGFSSTVGCSWHMADGNEMHTYVQLYYSNSETFDNFKV